MIGRGPPCPWCRKRTDAEHVDNGVGFERMEPWGCYDCEAFETTSSEQFEELKAEGHPTKGHWVCVGTAKENNPNGDK